MHRAAEGEVAQRNVVGVAAAYLNISRRGVRVRRFGQEIIRVTAGKSVNGTGSEPGGVSRRLTPAERDELAAQVPELTPWREQAADLVEQLRDADAARREGFAALCSNWLSLVRHDGALDLYDGVLRARR